MRTRFRGTFVISWAQTEVDGQVAAPLSALRVGAALSWSGEAVRVDGPQDVLQLSDDASQAEVRRRAAAQVNALLRAVDAAPPPTVLWDDGSEPPADSLIVTDGRQSWTVTLVPAGRSGRPLVIFAGGLPPRQTDLWVVRHSLTGRRATEEEPCGVVCFTPGTTILTATGPRPVEDLAEGDQVQTKDNGPAEILWIGRRRLSGARLHAMPHLAPIRLRAGALDKGVPDAGLLVSPDHRLILRGPRARALYNTPEVLVTARDLVNDRSVTLERHLREVTYIHLLLPRHEIVFANAVETESFHPASADLATMDEAQRAALLRNLPGVASDPMSYGPFSRRILSRGEAAILAHGLE